MELWWHWNTCHLLSHGIVGPIYTTHTICSHDLPHFAISLPLVTRGDLVMILRKLCHISVILKSGLRHTWAIGLLRRTKWCYAPVLAIMHHGTAIRQQEVVRGLVKRGLILMCAHLLAPSHLLKFSKWPLTLLSKGLDSFFGWVIVDQKFESDVTTLGSSPFKTEPWYIIHRLTAIYCYDAGLVPVDFVSHCHNDFLTHLYVIYMSYFTPCVLFWPLPGPYISF